MSIEPRLVNLRARWVLPVAGPPIDGGVVTLRGPAIVAVGRIAEGGDVHDLGDVAIVPGLVNAHTHLEFSDLPAPLGTPGMPITAWIRQVIAHRRLRREDDCRGAIARGFAESLAEGTTTLGEIATSDWRPALAAGEYSAPAVRMFRELIAPADRRVDDAVTAAESFLSVDAPPITPGLSPHAPYTVHPRLLSELVRLAKGHRVPLAMHLAESREELELLQTGGGPFRQMLAELGAWDADPAARLPSAMDYLQSLAAAPRALVIHGNYLDSAEIEFLAQRAATMSLVFCPRTHHFFQHEPYPLAQLLETGVAVAVGTDSRASNPDLSLFDELRFVAEHHFNVDPADVLALGTQAGARALGLADRVGTLEAGKQADLAVIDLAGGAAGDPHACLFGPAARVRQTWIAGQWVGSSP